MWRFTTGLQLNVREKSQGEDQRREQARCVQETERSSVWTAERRLEGLLVHGRAFGFHPTVSGKPSKGEEVTLSRGVTDPSNRSRSRFSHRMLSPGLSLLHPTSHWHCLYHLVSISRFFQPDPSVLVPLTTEAEENWLYPSSLSLNFIIFSGGMHSQPFTKWGLF